MDKPDEPIIVPEHHLPKQYYLLLKKVEFYCNHHHYGKAMMIFDEVHEDADRKIAEAITGFLFKTKFWAFFPSHIRNAFVCQLCCNSCSTVRRYICWYRETSSKGGQLARLKSVNYALIFPENILLTLFFISMNTIFIYFRICENSYK